jgi:hypothetical protein
VVYRYPISITFDILLIPYLTWKQKKPPKKPNPREKKRERKVAKVLIS